MKEITIKVSDNCELKQDGNTYTIVEKEKKLTYDGIAKELFNNCCCYIDSNGSIIDTAKLSYEANDLTNCVTRKQAEKLLAINKLMNVAKYINDGWQPNWESALEYKWFIYISNLYNKVSIDSVTSMQQHFIYFKSKEIAQQAIEILGEDTIKLALCTDY